MGLWVCVCMRERVTLATSDVEKFHTNNNKLKNIKQIFKLIRLVISSSWRNCQCSNVIWLRRYILSIERDIRNAFILVCLSLIYSIDLNNGNWCAHLQWTGLNVWWSIAPGFVCMHVSVWVSECVCAHVSVSSIVLLLHIHCKSGRIYYYAFFRTWAKAAHWNDYA